MARMRSDLRMEWWVWHTSGEKNICAETMRSTGQSKATIGMCLQFFELIQKKEVPPLTHKNPALTILRRGSVRKQISPQEHTVHIFLFKIPIVSLTPQVFTKPVCQSVSSWLIVLRSGTRNPEAGVLLWTCHVT